MNAFDEMVRGLEPLSREEMVRALDDRARTLEDIMRSANLSRRHRMSIEAAFSQRERVGRFLWFLQNGRGAFTATSHDMMLCRALADALRSRRDWPFD